MNNNIDGIQQWYWLRQFSWACLLVSLLCITLPVLAENKEGENVASGQVDKNDGKKAKDLDTLLKGLHLSEGYLDVYRDHKNGDGFVVISDAQLDKPIIYFAQAVDGALDAGAFRGQFRETKLIQFRRYFNTIQLVALNPRFYFDENSEIKRAAKANVNEAVLVSTKIVAEKDGRMAIKLSDLVLSEQLHKVSPWPTAEEQKDKKRFKLGKFDAKKSRITDVESFPENTHIIVDFVFANDAPKERGGKELSDPRFVSIKLQHAFIQNKKSEFVSRPDDARIGYFSQQFDDLTSGKNANYRDVINRWHLQRKNPEAELSDPVKPITWWIENTTPKVWRPTIKEAVLAWNTAFEKAGISNAIEVKVQPDDAAWSANDIRYNVLRWTSSPRPLFGGYGPSVANPLTGEIIAADIMLEYTFLQNRWFLSQIYTDGLSSPRRAFSSEASHCAIGEGLLGELTFGGVTAVAMGMPELAQDKLLKQTMYYLILHEVGHTLGLNHNMRASQLHNHVDIHNVNITQGILTGSVMDYPAVNFAPPGLEQGDFYQYKPGPYDDWAIEYGYSQALSDPEAEAKRLSQILARSIEPQLAFGNDADDMRQPGIHIDPRSNIFDLSSDAIAYAEGRFHLINTTFPELVESLTVEGSHYHDVFVGSNALIKAYGRQADVVSRYVGGVFIERAVVGQGAALLPYSPVPAATQKKAMQLLTSQVFAPDVLAALSQVTPYLQRQRRGFDLYGKNEDPKVHQMVLGVQKKVLDHLLHVNVMERLVDTQVYGNDYPLAQMLAALTDGVFQADIKKTVNSFRRNLQVELVQRLISISGLTGQSAHSHVVKALATYELDRIRTMIKKGKGDAQTKAHRAYLSILIKRAFDAK